MIQCPFLVKRTAGIVVFTLVAVLMLAGCQEKPAEPDSLIIFHYNKIVELAKNRELNPEEKKEKILGYWNGVQKEVEFAVKQLENSAKAGNNPEIDEQLERVFDTLRLLSNVLADEGISL
ncbi:MAG: hypothetical protein JW904_12560 [Spirochaetales bacterium]|nr:hypothetical protein [Spirochaetales bacterium]